MIGSIIHLLIRKPCLLKSKLKTIGVCKRNNCLWTF